MAVRFIQKYDSSKSTLLDFPNAAGVGVDTNDGSQLKFNKAGVIKTAVDLDSAQSLSGKTLVAPVISGASAVGAGSTLTSPTITNPLVTGAQAENAAAAAAQSVVTVDKSATALANAAATDFDVACVVSVPNANHAATVAIDLHVALGDQDSTEASFWTIAISRIAGAAAKAVVSAKTGNVNTAGVTANAAGAITVVVAGAAGAVNTINIKVTVTRSAGASTNHDALARLTLMNTKAAGVTIA